MPIVQTEADMIDDAVEYYVTYADQEFIRIEDEDGCSVSIRVTSSDFFILSIMVPEDLRLRGRGRGLLAAAEQMAHTKGKDYVRIAFVDSEAMSSFIKKCGYKLVDESLVSTFDINKSKIKIRVRQLMDKVPADYQYLSLIELGIGGFEEIMKFLKDKGLSSVVSRISDMDFDSSGVLNVGGVLSAVVLCARMGDDIYMDTAASIDESDQKIIAAATVSMLDMAIVAGARQLITDAPQGLSKKVMSIITEGYMGQESARWIYAIKRIEKPKEGALEISVHRDIQPELRNEWQRELRHLPLQRGLAEKTIM